MSAGRYGTGDRRQAVALFFRSIIILSLVLFASPALAWEATVLSVHDGDSIVVSRADNGERVKIRLSGIDAPEMPVSGRWEAQPYCKKSRDFLRAMLPVGSRVTLIDMGLDKYTRNVAAVVSLPDGRVAQEELLKAGFAWVYRQYCKGCVQWLALEQEARSARRGLWKQQNPVPPWEWRKGNRSEGTL